MSAPRAGAHQDSSARDLAAGAATPLRRRRAWGAVPPAIATVVALGLIVSLAVFNPGIFGGKLTIKSIVTTRTVAGVGVSGVYLRFSGATCWSSDYESGFGIDQGQEFSVTATLAYPDNSSLPGACDVTVVSLATEGFTIVSSNAPLVVSQGGSAELRLTIRAPDGAFHGPLQIAVTDAWPITDSFAASPTPATNSTGLGAKSWCGTSAYLLADTIHAGDWGYRLQVDSSSVTMGNILLRVVDSNGGLDASLAGFYLANRVDEVAACAGGGGGTMSGGDEFTYPLTADANGSTPLSTSYTIFIDMGGFDPVGQGFALEVLGQLPFTGSTSPVPLP